MATLTTAEKNEIRLLAGDDCTTPLVDDAQLQLFWDATGSVVCATVVKVLQARLAAATRQVSVDDTGRALGQHPLVSQIKTAIDYWMDNCPEALPPIDKLYVNLGIDEETRTVNIES